MVKTLDLNIPESTNDTPDLLDEALYNIEWMKTMQDPADGGVYHKLTHRKFTDFAMPADIDAGRVVVMKTTSASLNFAAVLAQTSRVYVPLGGKYADLAETWLNQAILAWDWAKANPEVYYEQPEDVNTGAYSDENVNDEFAWAAVELFVPTSEKRYLENLELLSKKLSVPTWGNTLGLAYFTLIRNIDAVKPYDLVDAEKLTDNTVALADEIAKIYTESGYATSIEKFAWGSNSDVLNQGTIQLMAYLLTEGDKYIEPMISGMGYVLGRNPLHKSFVTGFGYNRAMNVHPSVA